MPIYDISLTISNNLPVWPGDTPINLVRNKDMQQGELYTLSQLTSTVHMGTHLDAPMHFLRDGYGVDQIDLNQMIGPCLVIDLPAANSIDAAALEQANIPARTRRLLIRTRNSDHWVNPDNVFHTDFVAIEPSGAEWLVQHGLQLVGVDYLSVGAYEGGTATHEILLSHDVIPVEGLDLSRIEPGEYQLICLPLKIKDCDGAPVRAVLTKDEG